MTGEFSRGAGKSATGDCCGRCGNCEKIRRIGGVDFGRATEDFLETCLTEIPG